MRAKPGAHALPLEVRLAAPPDDDVADAVAVDVAGAAHRKTEQRSRFSPGAEEKLRAGLAGVNVDAARGATPRGIEGCAHREVARAVVVDISDVGRYPAEVVARCFSGQREEHVAALLDTRRTGYAAVRCVAPRARVGASVIARSCVDRAVGQGVIRGRSIRRCRRVSRYIGRRVHCRPGAVMPCRLPFGAQPPPSANAATADMATISSSLIGFLPRRSGKRRSSPVRGAPVPPAAGRKPLLPRPKITMREG